MSFEEDISIFDKIENPIDNNYIEKSYSFEEEENDDTSNDIVDINAQPAYYDSLGRKIDVTRYGNVVVLNEQVDSVDDDTEKEQFILELISKSGRELDKQLIRLSQSKKNKHEENKPKPTMIKKEEYYPHKDDREYRSYNNNSKNHWKDNHSFNKKRYRDKGHNSYYRNSYHPQVSKQINNFTCVVNVYKDRY